MNTDYATLFADIVRPLAKSLGLMLWGIEILGSSRPVVRIYVDVADRQDTPDLQVGEEFAVQGDFDRHALPEDIDDLSEEGAFLAEDNGGKLPLPAGVSIDQCSRLSRRVGLAFDVEAPFAAEWVLEVSSPGFARPFFTLDQLHSYIGKDMDVVLASPVEAWPQRKKFSGTLVAVGDETFSLVLPVGTDTNTEAAVADIPWQHVRKVNLVHVFEVVNKKAGSVKQRQLLGQ